MNSEPKLDEYTGIVTSTRASAAVITAHFRRSDQVARVRKPDQEPADRVFFFGMNGAHEHGVAHRHSQSGRKLKFFKWVNNSRKAGSRVMASTAATSMARFLV